MTLSELSLTYRSQAGVLRERIKFLEGAKEEEKDREARERLCFRIRTLEEMWREARDIAVLLERYYERGYRRNGKYTL